MLRPISSLRCRLIAALAPLALMLALAAPVCAQVSETLEIVYSGVDAQPLRDKATQLGTVVAIYEHLHNTMEFSPYHGSRSGSVNTYLGRRGSDVDIASGLIAMLRSRAIPSRYAVGTIRLPSAQLQNWLGIGNLDVAVQVLRDQGIQGVVLAGDRSSVDFEHVWAEALVPFDQYRGINTVNPAVDCSQAASAARCTWVSLDASFKQKTYNGLNLDPYNALAFDYTAYYNAIRNNDATRRDKNPLTILEDQIGAWLRGTNPGKTLEDVEDAGRIVELREGLLPASLPYQVVGSIRRYDTIAAHDAVVPGVEAKKWDKSVSVTMQVCKPGDAPVSMGSATVSLVEVTTRKLTSVVDISSDGTLIQQVFRRGTEQIGDGYINVSSGSLTFVCTDGSIKQAQLGMKYWIHVEMDGAPGASSGATDAKISADYAAVIGGYYLVATGGESSNWSQVHRAADQLLTSNGQYRIAFRPGEAGCLADGTNCTPYVDANGNGWDSSDTRLLDHKPALDALTGGLLYVGATQYFAKLHEQFERADRLMKTKTPVIGFLGVVSSVYEAEYIDGTAFSILPGGLLIDMKGITIGGSYRTADAALNFSNRQFEFLAHITSSLEHEVWQELTGYDAVSTVRGIQMSLANGATLLNPMKNSSSDTLPGLYPSFGFSTSAPTGFTYNTWGVYSTSPATWSHATQGSGFDTLLATVSTSTNPTQRLLATYTYYSTLTGLFGWSDCVRYWQARLINYVANNLTLPPTVMCGETFSGPAWPVYNQHFQNYWNNTIIPNYIGQQYFDYFDRNKGFSTTGRVFRTSPPAVDAQDALTIASIRNDLYLRDLSQSWVEYLIPSKLTVGTTYRFAVDIRKQYQTSNGRLTAMSMEIANRSVTAGGGYVGLEGPADGATTTTPARPQDNIVQGK